MDLVSFLLGIAATYAFSGLLMAVLCIVESRQARKERDEAVDQLLANVALRCIERPVNVRCN